MVRKKNSESFGKYESTGSIERIDRNRNPYRISAEFLSLGIKAVLIGEILA